MREVIALEKTEKSKTGALSLFTLVTLAAGQVIGAGVVSTTGVAIAKTGSSVWLAYGAGCFAWPFTCFSRCAVQQRGSIQRWKLCDRFVAFGREMGRHLFTLLLADASER